MESRSFARAAVCCLMAAVPWPLLHAEAITLPEAVAEAQTQNPEFRLLTASAASARGAALATRTWDNPQLTIEPGVRRALEDTAFVTGFNGTLSITQNFKFPGKGALEKSLAETDVKLRQLAIEAFRFQIAAKVRRTFFQLLAGQEIIKARQAQVALAKKFIEAARSRAKEGYAGEFETLKGQSDLVTAQTILREAEGRAATARIALNTLLARPPNAPLSVSGSLDRLILRGEARDFTALALVRHPALRILDVQAEKAGLSLRRARLEPLPDLTAGPSIEYYRDEQIYSLSAELPLPLWNWNQGGIQTASAQQKQILAEIERTRREIAGGVATAAVALGVARDQSALYTPAFLDELRRFLAQAEEGYAQNTASLLTYLEAKRTYFDAQAASSETLGRTAAALADLEAAVGVPLDLNP